MSLAIYLTKLVIMAADLEFDGDDFFEPVIVTLDYKSIHFAERFESRP